MKLLHINSTSIVQPRSAEPGKEMEMFWSNSTFRKTGGAAIPWFWLLPLYAQDFKIDCSGKNYKLPRQYYEIKNFTPIANWLSLA